MVFYTLGYNNGCETLAMRKQEILRHYRNWIGGYVKGWWRVSWGEDRKTKYTNDCISKARTKHDCNDYKQRQVLTSAYSEEVL